MLHFQMPSKILLFLTENIRFPFFLDVHLLDIMYTIFACLGQLTLLCISIIKVRKIFYSIESH